MFNPNPEDLITDFDLNDSEWIEIDPWNKETWPEHEQDVVYYLTIFDRAYKGKFCRPENGDWGRFYSSYGFCDWHDAPYWKPVKE